MRVPGINTKRILLVSIALTAMTAGSTQAADCAAALTCSQEEIDAIPLRNYSNPHWAIQLTPSGYSDVVVYRQPPYPRVDPRDPEGPAPLHEMYSGEWAGALRYNSITQWFPICFRYPDWASGTTMMIIDPYTSLGDVDGDGMDEGFSTIGNNDFTVRVEYDWDDTVTGVAMNTSRISTDAFVMSDRYVLRQRYMIQNISGSMIPNVSFYQFTSPHPANTETATVDIGYDETLRAVGAFTDFRYDMTALAMNSGITDGYPTGSMFGDAVGFSSNVAPAAHDLDYYEGHGAEKPLTGAHCNVENDTMNNANALTQGEVGGSMRWDLGTFLADEIQEIEIIMSVASAEYGNAADACLHITDGADPEIMLSKGLCKGQSPAGPYDIIRGSLAEPIVVPGCDKSFDCVGLINPECLAQGYGMDRYDLTDDAHPLDALYYAVRNSAAFTSWGMGQGPLGSNPWVRFYFSPTDSIGVDICPVP